MKEGLFLWTESVLKGVNPYYRVRISPDSRKKSVISKSVITRLFLIENTLDEIGADEKVCYNERSVKSKVRYNATLL